jgi:hypothetical protein
MNAVMKTLGEGITRTWGTKHYPSFGNTLPCGPISHSNHHIIFYVVLPLVYSLGTIGENRKKEASHF